ncbi:MAG: hypothetical protein ACREV9_12925 [Burkholderiales bacterium]
MKFLLTIAAIIVAGCAAAPAIWPVDSSPRIKARVAIAMSPEERTMQTQLYYYYKGVWFEEGRVVREAALKAFTERFEAAASREDSGSFDVVVEVEGNSILNPQFSTYYATAIARAYLPNGELIGQYSATSSHYASFGNLDYEQLYQQTYNEAFAQVARQLAQSEALARALKRGAPA